MNKTPEEDQSSGDLCLYGCGSVLPPAAGDAALPRLAVVVNADFVVLHVVPETDRKGRTERCGGARKQLPDQRGGEVCTITAIQNCVHVEPRFEIGILGKLFFAQVVGHIPGVHYIQRA